MHLPVDVRLNFNVAKVAMLLRAREFIEPRQRAHVRRRRVACNVFSALRDAFQASFRRGSHVAVPPYQLETVCEWKRIVHEHFVSADLNTESKRHIAAHTIS